MEVVEVRKVVSRSEIKMKKIEFNPLGFLGLLGFLGFFRSN
jgi:hypothetical protein